MRLRHSLSRRLFSGQLSRQAQVRQVLLRYAPVFGLCVVLAACISTTKRNEETLASLDSQVVKVEPQDAVPVARAKSNEQARQSYKQFVQSTRNEGLRIRAMERLADLDMEGNETKQIEEVQHTEQVMRNLGTPIDVFEAPRDTAADYEAVAKQYEDLLAKGSNPKKNESVLYQLARAYDMSGQLEKSLDALSRLITQFPYTKRREEIQFRRGELYFQLKNYVAAKQAYAEVMKNDDSAYYERSIYKHGWCVFKLSDFNGALKSFYSLLDTNFKGGKTIEDFSKTEKNLIDDTFRVISLIFSYQKGPESIKEYSRQAGKRVYEHLLYSHLADLYMEQERFEDAASTYAAFVELYPNTVHSPDFMISMIDIYEKGGFTSSLIKTKAGFVTLFGMQTVYWSLVDNRLMDKIKPQVKKNLTELAKHYHSIGQKSKKRSDYQAAARWYKEFVVSFPSDPETPEMNFLLAENLSESGDLVGAATEYEKTAYQYGPHKRQAEAGYAALLAHQGQVQNLSGEAQMEKRKMAVASAIQFADTYPSDNRVPNVLLKAAEEYVDFKDMASAALVARRITEMPKPPKDIVPAALAIIAAAEFELGNLKQAELATIKRLRATPTDDKNRGAHVERLAAAVYKQGEAALKEGNLEAAADHFLRIRGLAPNSTIRVTAEIDAAAAYLKMEAWNRAIPVLVGFIKEFPKHEYIEKAIKQLAVAYEKIEDWGSAAYMYQQIAEREPDKETQREILWQTAQLYEKAKNRNSALAVYSVYIKLYPQPLEQAVEARQKLADTLGEQQEHEKRQGWLREIVSADKAGPATERTRFLAAKASLELAEPTYNSYHSVNLVQPLKQNLKIKKDLLQASVDSYTAAANYGVAEVTTASTYRIAQIYSEFSKALFASERPKGLSAEELEQYDLLLEEQAFPFEEKAIDIHESNASRANEGLYDQWIKESMLALRKLKPVRYAKNERSDLFTTTID